MGMNRLRLNETYRSERLLGAQFLRKQLKRLF